MVIIPHLLYSPDLAPCDFALFSKSKMKLKGRHFKIVSYVQEESQAVLESIKEIYIMVRYISLFARWKYFGGMPMEVLLDGSITRAAYRGYTRSK
jgi:hypothetical protein